MSQQKRLALVGERIRQMRSDAGITLSDAAAQSGITVAYLSQIERNLAEPSLPVLRRISKALRTEMSVFFAGEGQTDVLVTRAGEAELTEFERVRYRFMMPLQLSGGARCDLSVMIAYISPCPAEETEDLVHEGAEFNTVLSGEVSYRIEGEDYHLRAGDSIYIERGVQHRVYNLSSEVTVSLAAIELVK